MGKNSHKILSDEPIEVGKVVRIREDMKGCNYNNHPRYEGRFSHYDDKKSRFFKVEAITMHPGIYTHLALGFIDDEPVSFPLNALVVATEEEKINFNKMHRED